MLKTTTTRSAENLPFDMAENAEFKSRTGSRTRSDKNLLALVDMAKDVRVGEGDGGNDEAVERLPLSKKSNGPIGYLASLGSKKRWVSLNSFGHCWSFQLKALLKKI